MNSESPARRYNRFLSAAIVFLIPSLVFWISVLVYAVAHSEHFLIRALANLERDPSGVTLVVFIVIGCPFFALPLSVLGRWLARTEHQKGQNLGTWLLAASIVLLILGTVGALLWS